MTEQEVLHRIRDLEPDSPLNEYRAVFHLIERLDFPTHLCAEYYKRAYIAEHHRKKEASWLQQLWWQIGKASQDEVQMHEQLLEWDWKLEQGQVDEKLKEGKPYWVNLKKRKSS